VFGTLRDIAGTLGDVLAHVGPALLTAFADGDAVSDTMSVFGVVIGFAADHLQAFASWLPVIIAGFIAYKIAMAASVAVQAAAIPIDIARTVSNFTLAAAIRAQQAATQAAAVAQTELDVAMDANPIGVIIIVIVALVAAFLYLWFHCTGFRVFWIKLWKGTVASAKEAWHWIQDTWNGAIDWIGKFTGRIAKIAGGMWEGLKTGLKAAINWIIQQINAMSITLNNTVIGTLNHLPGVHIPNIPLIPSLAEGGIVPATPGGRLVRVAEGGESEVVAPLSKLGSMGGGPVKILIELSGSEALKKVIRKIVHDDGGGNV